MSFMHSDLAKGGWEKYSLVEQMGNIGSEVNRAIKHQKQNPEKYAKAVTRALELFDLTINDTRWRSRLKEIVRAREEFCDAAFDNGQSYQSSLEDINKYLFQFALAARIKK